MAHFTLISRALAAKLVACRVAPKILTELPQQVLYTSDFNLFALVYPDKYILTGILGLEEFKKVSRLPGLKGSGFLLRLKVWFEMPIARPTHAYPHEMERFVSFNHRPSLR